MKAQPWMIFQPEGEDVHYLWNGHWPILVNCPPNMENQWYWNGTEPKNLRITEKRTLDAIAANDKKHSFTVPRKKGLKFKVIERGVFEKL